MKRPLALPVLIGVLVVGLLVGCQQGAAPDPTRTPVPAPSLTATAPETATWVAAAAGTRAVASATSTATELPSPTTSPSALPTSTPPPSPAPTVTATEMPTRLPPAASAVAGESLAISLDWRLDANGHLTAAAIDLTGARSPISLASLGRRVYGLTASGSVRWQLRTRGPVYALTLLTNGQLATGDDAGSVTVLDGRGRALWTADLGSRATALHAAPQGGLFAGGWDEQLSRFDASGHLRWQAPLGAPVSSIATLQTQDTEQVLVTALDGRLWALDLGGQELWGFDAGCALTTMDTVSARGSDLALLGAQDGRLLALDGQGVLQWERTLGTGAPVWHAVQLDRGGLGVVAGTGGTFPTLALLSAAGGEVRWRIALPAAAGAITSLDLDGDGGIEILVGLANGQVQAYDLQGRLRGGVHAGLPVSGLYPAADGSAIILADVAAWHLVGRPGPGGDAWLPSPALSPAPSALPGMGAISPSPGQSDPEGGLLVFLGDVAFGRSMEAQLARYGPAYPWQGLGPLLNGEDPQAVLEGQQPPVLTIVNLECSLTTQGQPLDKSYLIRAHPLWARSLVAGGIDLVTLANNHALDFGAAGLQETTETLEALGIEAVGAGISAEAAHQPAFFDLGGVRVAFLGYAAARWDGSVDVPATDLLAWARPAVIRADVKAVRDRADFVVVLLHAGTEYASSPSADQIAAAHAAIDAGADLVVGHHPHVTQTVEHYRGGVIVYSLGDAVFDIPRASAMRGHLLRVRVTANGLAGAELWPFWIEGAIQPRLLDGGQGTPLVETIYP